MQDETVVKIVTIVALSCILLASVVMLGVVAVLTDRDLLRAEAFTFGGVLLVAALGGFSWWSIRRRRRWRMHLEHGNGNGNGES